MATRIQGYFEDGTCIVAFDEDCINTTVTESGNVAGAWVDDIYRIHRRRLHRLVVGLDVEWRPPASSTTTNDNGNNNAAGHPPPPVAVLQLCVGRRCLVFQILRADYVPDALFDFLGDDRFYFVGVGVHDDAAKLRAQYGLEVARAKDLRGLAAYKFGKPELRRAGLHTLAWEVMGVKMHKPYHVRVGPWDARRLSRAQLMCACADAFASFEIGRRLYDGDF